MNSWFVFLLLIVAFETGVVMVKHGQPRTDNFSFWTQAVSSSIFIFVVYKAIQTGF